MDFVEVKNPFADKEEDSAKPKILDHIFE